MQVHARDGRPLPSITPTTKPFFDAAREQTLLLPHCPRDGFFFYPRSRCPACLRADWSWRSANKQGRIHAYTVDRVGQDPGQRSLVPFAIALVDLDAGPRLVGRIVDCPPDAVCVGMPVMVCFEIVDNTPLLCFTPV